MSEQQQEQDVERPFTVRVPFSGEAKIIVYATDEEDAREQAESAAYSSFYPGYSGSVTLSDFEAKFDDVDFSGADVKEGEDYT
jgi:hypothetical protein